MDELTPEEKKRIRSIYGSDESPLKFTIKPRLTAKIREAREITKEDFE